MTKSFAGATAIAHVDLAIRSGRTTVLLGPSGCGKSTILRLIIGLLTPDSGALVFDEDIEDAAAQRRAGAGDELASRRQRMGYVIQDGGLFPHLTARENVLLMPQYLGWSEERMTRRVAELAELVRLPQNALDRYPVQLSGGQRQRVSLMRALVLDPALLLLDEPLGALDPMIRADLQDDLRGVFRTLGKTVVLVTHDLSEAAFLGDWIVLLRDGVVVQEGRLADLLRAPAEPFVTQFINAQRRPLAALESAA